MSPVIQTATPEMGSNSQTVEHLGWDCLGGWSLFKLKQEMTELKESVKGYHEMDLRLLKDIDNNKSLFLAVMKRDNF